MKKAHLVLVVIIILAFNSLISGQTYTWINIDTYHNSSVLAGTDPSWDHSAFQKWLIKRNTNSAYNGLDYLGEATTEYNCHFYAWFKTENYSNNQYWVNYPSENWDDFSFMEMSNETYPGKVTYYDTDGIETHSTITTSSQGRYKSKWGSGCLWEHDWDECPYAAQTFLYAGRNYYERLAVSGPEIVCTSNSTFSIQSLPSGASATWSVSPGNRVSPSSGTGTSATFSASCLDIGDATVTFAISGSGNTASTSDDFYAGGADYELDMYYTDGTQAPMGGSTFLQCPNTYYHIYISNNSTCGSSNYSWIIPTGWTMNYQYSNMISIYTNSSPGGQVQVKGSTCCSGCGSNVSLLIDYVGTYWDCGGYYMASPNPGSDFVEINETIVTTGLKSAVFDRDIAVTVYNTFGSVVHSANIHVLPYRIETGELPTGKYVVRIIDGEIVENIQIIIER